MRDYLKLWEIEEVLDQILSEEDVNDIMKQMKSMSETCLCMAHSYSECLCGAWENEE